MEKSIKWFRKLICYLFGHNWRCLYREHWLDHDGISRGSETTCWECSRCKEQDHQQWDNR